MGPWRAGFPSTARSRNGFSACMVASPWCSGYHVRLTAKGGQLDPGWEQRAPYCAYRHAFWLHARWQRTPGGMQERPGGGGRMQLQPDARRKQPTRSRRSWRGDQGAFLRQQVQSDGHGGRQPHHAHHLSCDRVLTSSIRCTHQAQLGDAVAVGHATSDEGTSRRRSWRQGDAVVCVEGAATTQTCVQGGSHLQTAM